MAFVGSVALTRTPFLRNRALCRNPTGASWARSSCRSVLLASAQAARGRTQQETDWNSVSILENSVSCEAHRLVVVNVGTTDAVGSLADAYRYPGMYVQMRRDANCKPAFLAVSSAPNIQGIFEFLIKDSDSLSWIDTLRPGDDVQMTPVMGKGFPVSPTLDLLGYPPIPEDEVPRDLILCATGAGIAPIRACIESRLNGLNLPQRRSVKLYYGARYAERMAYVDRFGMWEEDGVEVIPVMSRPDDGKDKWEGRTGYIQHAIKEDGVKFPKETGVLLCGLKDMAVEVRSMMVEAGVPDGRILTNF